MTEKSFDTNHHDNPSLNDESVSTEPTRFEPVNPETVPSDAVNHTFSNFAPSDFEPKTAPPENLEPVLQVPEPETASISWGQAHPQYSPATVRAVPVPPTQKRTRKPGLTKSGAALVIALCIIFSAAFGLGGGVVGYQLLNQNNTGPSQSQSGQSGNSNQNSSINIPTNMSEESLTNAQVVEKAAPSVVEITTETVTSGGFMQQYVTSGAGSGVIISEDGYIVTNNHVIEDANKVVVTLKDGTSYDATLVATDAETDIAVIKINVSNLTPVTFGDSASLIVGQRALAIGNPLGSLGGTVTEGIISALDREITIDNTTMTLLQTTAAVNPGNSGGGLFDEFGNLIGLVNAKSTGTDVEGLGFAIPVNTVASVVSELIENGYVSGRVRLGITMISIADERTAMMYRVSKYGIYILQIEENSNAANAGLRAGDYLVSMNGVPIETTDDAQAVLKEVSVGDTMSITIERNGEQKTVQVFIGESVS